MKTIIYHSADFDGIFCREIAKKFLGTKGVNYVGWNFGDTPIPIPLEGQIIIMDLPFDEPFGFKYPKDSVPTEIQNAIWIDHHKSAIEKAPGTIPGYRIDGVAACRLAWQWFMRGYGPNQEMAVVNNLSGRLPSKEEFVSRNVVEPLAVRLAGEYDIWDHRGDGDLEFQFGLRVQGENPDWHSLLSENPSYTEMCVAQGKVAMAYSADADATTVKARSYLTDWEGMKFLTLNTARCNSLTFDIRDVPETGHDALLAYYFNGKVWSVSLYHAKHRKDLDLSQIAVKYGGGGHRGACGFTCDKLPFLQ